MFNEKQRKKTCPKTRLITLDGTIFFNCSSTLSTSTVCSNQIFSLHANDNQTRIDTRIFKKKILMLRLTRWLTNDGSNATELCLFEIHSFPFSSARWMSWDSWAVSFMLFFFFTIVRTDIWWVVSSFYFFLVFSINCSTARLHAQSRGFREWSPWCWHMRFDMEKKSTAWRFSYVHWTFAYLNNSLPLCINTQLLVEMNNRTFWLLDIDWGWLTMSVEFHHMVAPFILEIDTIRSHFRNVQKQLGSRRRIFPVFIKHKKRSLYMEAEPSWYQIMNECKHDTGWGQNES